MAGLKYVGAPYTVDSSSQDLVSIADATSAVNAAPTSQVSADSQITAALGGYATKSSVASSLSGGVAPLPLFFGGNYTLSVTYSVNSSGTFTLSYGSASTTLPYNCSQTQISNALQLLTGVTSVSVTGSNPFSIGVQPPSPALTINTTGLVGASATLTPGTLAPASWSGQFVAPLVGGTIPAQYVPSFGQGYLRGPFGPTQVTSTSSYVVAPTAIADWAIGPTISSLSSPTSTTNYSYQPMCFMSLLVTSQNGGRPLVEVKYSSTGNPAYASQVLVAKGVGRNNWNDAQAVTVTPVPFPQGAQFVAGPNSLYTAWVSDPNQQGVSVSTGQIANAGIWLIRYSA